MKRRTFLQSSAAAVAVAGVPLGAAIAAERKFNTTLKKARILSPKSKKPLEALKKAGFEGIETQAWNASPEEAAKTKKMADEVGIEIHSVMRGWANFNNPDRFEGDIKSVERALLAAEAYGAGAVLLVPCRTGGKIPSPGDFKITFDPNTLHVSKVVEGDNKPFTGYIDAQNKATEATRRAVEKLIPVAEKTGVKITLENVWNNLWTTPEFFAALINSFDDPNVRAYFDIGNHRKYSPPELWIKALGDKIERCHIKDFKLDASGHGGRFTKMSTGDVDWVAVRSELDKVGYSGWMTLEEGGWSPEQYSLLLDQFFAGKKPGI